MMNISEATYLINNLMLVIAILSLCIYRGQYKNTRYRLKLDVWDRRYEVYRGLMELLANSIDTPPTREDIEKYSARTAQKRFLFKDDLLAYMEQVRTKASELRFQKDRYDKKKLSRKIGTEEEETTDEKISELDKWLNEQAPIATERFQQYLGFQKNL